SDADTPGYAPTMDLKDRGLDVTFAAKQFRPDADFVVSYRRDVEASPHAAQLSAYAPKAGEFDKNEAGDAFAAMRMTVDLPEDAELPARMKRDRAVVVDTSWSQSPATLSGEIDLAMGLVRDLDETERFTALACDSACEAYPEDGLAVANEASLAAAEKWLRERKPRGSSNLAGALVDASKRLEPTGAAQLVLIGDGSPSAG